MKVGDIVLAKPDSDRAYCCTCFQKCFVGKIIYVEETRITVSGLHNLPNFEGSSLPFIVQKKYFVVANPKSLKFLEKHLEKRDYDLIEAHYKSLKFLEKHLEKRDYDLIEAHYPTLVAMSMGQGTELSLVKPSQETVESYQIF